MIRVLRAELGDVDNVEIQQVDALSYDLRGGRALARRPGRACAATCRITSRRS